MLSQNSLLVKLLVELKLTSTLKLGCLLTVIKSNLKDGKNLAVNRLKVINGLIKYDWLYLSMNV